MKAKFNKKTLFISTAIIFLFLSGLGFKILDDGDDFEIAKSFDLFHDVVREIRLFYVDDPDISSLISESTIEFLQKLDPYTVFYPESQMEEYTFMTTGAYGGIGAVIIERDEQLILADVYQNSPADKSGLKTGDYITAINGIEVKPNNISDLKLLLKGEPGSEVKLIIKRYGTDNNFEKTLVREKITFGDIPYYELIEDKYAYLKLNGFKMGAGNEVKKKLNELNSKSELKGIILDLRGNPGGLLIEAVNIANIFVNKGSEIVSTKGRISEWNQTYNTRTDALFPDIPVIVIINKGSASASEIVAGALQDYDRAVILGQRSFGKGLVQTTRKLSYNTGIKITTAKYYIPSGRCIQAINYSESKENGSGSKIPKSMISEFKTANGRKVYDGGGINPDVIIKEDSLIGFTKQLTERFIIFDFATQFYQKNRQISNVKDFEITNEIFKEFSEYVVKHAKELPSNSVNIADELIKSAEAEKHNEQTIQQIKKLKMQLVLDKKQATYLYKDQIIPVLETELIGRYYYNRGQIIAYMKHDKELIEALNIIKNKDKYSLLLSAISD